MEAGKGEIITSHPHPFHNFWPSLTSLVQISFSPRLSASIKIKGGGHNFHQENTEQSLAKFAPALQAKRNLKNTGSKLHEALELIVIDESQTVETWKGNRFAVL